MQEVSKLYIHTAHKERPSFSVSCHSIFMAIYILVHAFPCLPTSHFSFLPLHRLDNIIEFLKTVATYETLGLSRIEGIETFNARFGLLVSTLKKKSYDPLEHRKPDFDVDYQEFKLQLADLEVGINGV